MSCGAPGEGGGLGLLGLLGGQGVRVAMGWSGEGLDWGVG